MRARREILFAHYMGILKKLTTWGGLVALVSTLLVPLFGPAGALALGAQMTSRSVTSTDTAAGATDPSYTFSFKTATSGQTIGSIMLQICDSPLESVACVGTGNSSGASFITGTLPTTVVNPTGFAAATYTKGTVVAGGASGTSVLYAAGSALAETGNPQLSFPIATGITNPTASNVEYYARVTLYSSITETGEIGFAGMAMDTVPVMNVTANVQEDLTFAVGISGTTCATVAAAGATLILTPNPMTTSAVSTGTAKICASTNASAGYAINYNGTGFVGPSETIAAAPSTGSVVAAGSELFGLIGSAQTTGALSGAGGANPVGGIGAMVSQYSTTTNSTIAYNTPGPTPFATASGPSAATIFTTLFAAAISGVTKPGAYNATQTWIATGTF